MIQQPKSFFLKKIQFANKRSIQDELNLCIKSFTNSHQFKIMMLKYEKSLKRRCNFTFEEDNGDFIASKK